MSRSGLAAVALALLASAGATAQSTRFVAFGDSVTEGVGDETGQGGYPARLEALLNGEGTPATVENEGLAGETTAEGLTRMSAISGSAADTFLLMEGTNDISAQISPETIAANLDAMALKAGKQGFGRVVLATVVPRLPGVPAPSTIRETEYLGWYVRQTAYDLGTPLADPFEAFSQRPGNLADIYSDSFHPNGEGYDLLAETIADVVQERDRVGPVPAFLIPVDGADDVEPDVQLQIVIFDLGSGIDRSATTMLLDGDPVSASVNGDGQRLRLRYRPMKPLNGRVRLGVRSRDLATPPNEIDRTVADFVVLGSEFLTGDIDQSGRVDGADLVRLALAFGSHRGQTRFDAAADLDDDNQVDGTDLALLAANFGASL